MKQENPREMNLTWLQERQVGKIARANSNKKTLVGWEKPIADHLVKSAVIIAFNAKHIPKQDAMAILKRTEKESGFSLTPEFLTTVSKLGINIPFEYIFEDTYPDSIARRVEEAISHLA